MDLERKSFAEVKWDDLSTGSGSFEGYASVAGVLDSGGDIVEHGAFLKDLPDFLQHGFIGLGHDWDGLPIGTVSEAHEDDHGLFLRGEYHTTPEAQQARQVAIERQQRGKSVGLSIGFKINGPEGKSMDEDGHRRLKSLKLYEVSQVNVPMLRPAGLTSVKSETPFSEHGTRVLGDLTDYLARAQDRLELSVKEGRTLSAANRQKLVNMLESMGSIKALETQFADLLAMTEPQKAAVLEESKADYSALYAGFLLTQARLLGVSIPT
jgi:HK97 family phage prohead protease